MALGQYVRTRLALGRQALAANRVAEARDAFRGGARSRKHWARRDTCSRARAMSTIGSAAPAPRLKDDASARRYWMLASEFRGDFQGMRVRAYSEMTYYSALALERLGRKEEAAAMAKGLSEHAEALLTTPARIDYFATSLPTMLLFEQDLQKSQELGARVMLAQASLVLGDAGELAAGWSWCFRKIRTTRRPPICSTRSGANDRAIPPLFFEERGARSVSVFTLENEWLGLQASTDGAAIWRFFAKAGRDEVPLMLAPEGAVVRHAEQSACFPLVPFGNRVRDNRFMFEGAAHALAPNTTWDKHYLHGDGWTSEWRLAERTGARARLVMRHVGAGTPYTYDAAQTFTLDRSTLAISLEVVNRGATALPFGLGWHPYFPLTAGTTLRAPASSFWLEGADWLPTQLAPCQPI